MECLTGLQIRVRIGKIFSLFLIQIVCCGYSKEPSQCEGSLQHQKHIFELIGKEIIAILRLKICLSSPMSVRLGIEGALV